MALTGNKGEWSEIYALFKLLGDGQIHAGDGNLNRIGDLFYPIIKILREEEGRNYEFKVDPGDIVITGGDDELRLPVEEFKQQADQLFKAIKASSGAFPILDTEVFMRSIHCTKIKAKSSDKTDIKVVIHDLRTGICPTLGFSIKSQLGGSSTLINASGSTNFTYHIEGVQLTDEQITEINAISSRSKIKDRIARIKELGGKLSFAGIDSPVFQCNLVMNDSNMPEIVAELLSYYFSGEGTTLRQLTDLLQERNPIGYTTSCEHKFYEHKLKRLLTDAALGMKPATTWTGVYDANGGYLVVKEDGEVLCYHIYNRNVFEDYLLNIAYLDTPSSSRHNFGRVEVADGRQIFKLNLQIRFE